MAEGEGGTRSRRFPSKGGSGAEGEGGVAALGVQVMGCGDGGLRVRCGEEPRIGVGVVGKEEEVAVLVVAGGLLWGLLRYRGGSPRASYGYRSPESSHALPELGGFCAGVVWPLSFSAVALQVLRPPRSVPHEALCAPA